MSAAGSRRIPGRSRCPITIPCFTVYVATSLDGLIADVDGGVGWLEPFQAADVGFDDFLASVDTLVMGRTTYDQVLGFGAWPYAERPTHVLTTRPLGDGPHGVTAASDPARLVEELRATGGHVWVVGGSQTIATLLELDAVDVLDVFVAPVILGDGIPLFERESTGHALELIRATSCANGLARLQHRVLHHRSKHRT